MIWYLLICSFSTDKGSCTFSPPLVSQQQCQFVKKQLSPYWQELATCFGVRKGQPA